jgi:hypothetical protein
MLKDIGSFDLECIGDQPFKDIPKFVPMITKDGYDLHGLSEEIEMMAVPPRDLISSGKLNPVAKKGLHEFYNLDDEIKVLLVLTAKERHLELLWKNQFETDLFAELRDLGLYGVIGTNFTVGENHPRFLHFANMKRNNIEFNSIIKAGVYSIPDISWYNREDLNRWIDWLKHNHVNTIAITTQCMKANRRLFKSTLEDVAVLTENVGRELHIVFIGPGRTNPIQSVLKGQNSASVISNMPYRKAIAGERVYSQDNRFCFIKDTSKSKKELMRENIRFYVNAVSEISEAQKSLVCAV